MEYVPNSNYRFSDPSSREKGSTDMEKCSWSTNSCQLTVMTSAKGEISSLKETKTVPLKYTLVSNLVLPKHHVAL